jgi:23S rRNA (cytidine1920-2'-O)/16S rRNA (cytidine1409-2'-O)-methyltransferase
MDMGNPGTMNHPVITVPWGRCPALTATLVKKQRLDTLLVELGLCDSRQLAQRHIRAGEVKVSQTIIDKPGTLVDPTLEIVLKARSPYVSRGGEKLAHALTEFGIRVSDRIALDGGISTGGFTDCLFQAGAQRVYGIDVGYGQVDWRLRTNPNLILRERTNIRHLTAAELYQAEDPWPNLGVMDVSFISLGKVLPSLWELLIPPREAILLVKPQFEVGRDHVGKNGVVRAPEQQAWAIEQVIAAARSVGWGYQGLTHSPMKGPAGNIEYLLWLEMATSQSPPTTADLQQFTAQTAKQLN